jgi:hypothetical protein
MRAAAGWSRRIADVADCRHGRLSWADCSHCGQASAGGDRPPGGRQAGGSATSPNDFPNGLLFLTMSPLGDAFNKGSQDAKQRRYRLQREARTQQEAEFRTYPCPNKLLLAQMRSDRAKTARDAKIDLISHHPSFF